MTYTTSAIRHTNPRTNERGLPQTVPAAQVDFLPEDRRWIADRIQEVLATGQLTLGQYGASLEERFAHYCGQQHGVAVNSGTLRR